MTRVQISLLVLLFTGLLTLLPGTVLADDTRPRLNVLLICIDDLRPELNCYGVDYIHSPNIDALAKSGRMFSRHYVQAPTCGASRFTLLTGRYGNADNGALFARAKQINAGKEVPTSMPAWFRQAGYTTVSVGKVSHHPGGRGGSDWDDDAQPEMPNSWDRHLCPTGSWQHPRGIMHGLANGEIRVKRNEMAVLQSTEGDDSIYPDGLITETALDQMQTLVADSSKPFFLAVGIIRPHLPFGAPAKYMKYYEGVELPKTPHPGKPSWKSTWHGSGEFMAYNRWGQNPNEDAEFAQTVRRHYAACVTFADAQVGRIMEQLKATGQDKNTIVVLWGDHGWHLGERAIWGKHALFEESLRSPLIVRRPDSGDAAQRDDRVVETVDIFPTLCDMAGLPTPEACFGTSLVGPPGQSADETAVSYFRRGETIRTDQYRLILHEDGATELYDFGSDANESNNVAEMNPDVVQRLTKRLKSAMNGK